MIKNKVTEELTNQIISSNNLSDYISRNKENFFEISLSEYLKNIVKEKGLDEKEVRKNSGIDNTYVYEIFNGKKKNVARDKLILISLSMGLDLKETQRLLKLGGKNELYSRNIRDSIIIFSICQKYDIEKTEELLFNEGYESLYNHNK